MGGKQENAYYDRPVRGKIGQLIAAVEPYSASRAAHRALALFLASSIARIADRETLPAHLTASVFVVDPEGQRVLLTWHPKFQRWLQPGGHCDGEANVPLVAMRELHEETGLSDVALGRVPFDVDIHPGDPGGPPHMHVDVRFIAVARAGSSAKPPESPESLALGWFAPDELDDPYLRDAATAALTRAEADFDRR
jgi:8-oxo-dGTP pyrophosphatase MutT (NUDIX family)